MNRTALSVIALAIGSVLIMGLFNVYKPAVKHTAHDVFDKVRIGNMEAGESATGVHHSSKYYPEPHVKSGYGAIRVHYVDVSKDPNETNLANDPEIDEPVVLTESLGDKYNGDMLQNAPTDGIKNHSWNNTGKYSNTNLTYSKNFQDVYVGCEPGPTGGY